jgi:glycosyltransferase involved in cell wall biosynthesis
MTSSKSRSAGSQHNTKIITIWNTYGPYHLARVQALRSTFRDSKVVCLSHCATNQIEYPFFNITLDDGETIVNKDSAELSFLESLWATLRLLRKHRPDLILTCGYERAETLAAIIHAKLYNKRCFLMVDNRYEDRTRCRSVELTKSWYLKLFDGFIYGGAPHHRYLTRLGVGEDRMVPGYSCVDNDWIASRADETRAVRREPSGQSEYILCVARLVEKKNWIRLLAAYRAYVDLISRERKPWRLVIGGDGPMRNAIERQIADLGLDELVKMTGQVNDFAEIVRLHALAKVFVLASHHDEQWGLVVNEAMAAARPVLVSQECGCAEDLVRNGESGFTFDPYSPSDLAKKFVWMHAHENRLDDMGRCGRGIVERYSPSEFAKNVKWLYESCVGSSPKAIF